MNTHLEILVKELIKNGVSAKCCEIITDNDGNVSASEPFLDFSEHDKMVAEEKDKRIEELEKQIGGYRERNILLRQRCTAEARDLFDRDMFGSFIITIPRKSNDNAIIEKMEEDLNRLTMDLKSRMGQIHELKEKNEELDHMRKSWMETAQKWSELNSELQDKIAKLECSSKIISELEDQHQSDCIRINQLLTTIDVLTERYQKLREAHGL